MAANLYVGCIKCGKSGGTVCCNGCKQTLCFKHINEHKDELEKELEDLIYQENQFENDLGKDDDSNELFNKIDQWKRESIEEIKRIVKQTKQDLRELINQSNQNLLKQSQQIKENLYLLKQSDDLAETQLIQLANQFNNLKKQIHSFQLIKSTNSNFLKIEKQQINENEQPKPPLSPSSSPSTSKEKVSPNIEESHSKREGSILIREIDPYGYFVIIEHNGLTTDQEQDMIGWTIKRSIDDYQEIIYRFPNDFILKSKSFVKILSRESSQTLYSYEKKNILIAQAIQTWGIAAKTIHNRLIDATGHEKHILIQTFK